MATIPAPNIAALAGDIARAPQQEYAQSVNIRGAEQEQRERALQMKAQQRQLNDQDALTKAMTSYDPSKNTLADIPKLVTSNGGSGQAALQAQAGLITQRQNLLKLSDDQFALEQKKADAIQGVHDQVSQAAPEQKQQVYQQGLQTLSGLGVDVSKEPPQYPGDDAFSQHLPAIRLHSAILAEAEKDREITAKESESAAHVSEAATKATEAQTSQERLRAEMPGGPLEAPDKAELRSYLKDPNVPGEKLPVAQRTPASFVAWKAKQNPTAAIIMANMLGGAGTPEKPSALDQAAQRYSTTGELPAGFARSPGTTAAIIKRAADLNPGANIAANKATFSADTAALKKVQTQFDSMTAFEGTALKNLDLYAQIAAKIPDLGAKFANVPLRMVTGSMIGTDNMAALNAAHQTASSEVAKVLSSATGSGVLSDSQKKEAEDVINGNLPLSATLSVVNTLKQDMANRHKSYQDDIDAIKGRLGAKPQSTTPAAGADFFSQFGGKAR